MLFPKEISPISEVRFAGWRSTTLGLQQAGWQLSVSESVQYGTIQLALNFPKGRLSALSKPVQIDHRRSYGQLSQKIVFDIVWMNSAPQLFQAPDMSTFAAIDARPVVEMCSMQPRSIHDFNIFQPIPVPQEEIIVDPDRIGELLAKIHEAQLPEQARIRERARKREAMKAVEATHLHAQILSFKAAA